MTIVMNVYRCLGCGLPWLSIIDDSQCVFCHETGMLVGQV